MPGRIGLALAGGGPEGAVWEIGALQALDEAVDGLDLGSLHVYVGVSAGAFVASCLANGLSPRQLIRGMIRDERGEHPFRPETFFTPAGGELARRAVALPRHVAEGVARWIRNPGDLTLFESMMRLGRSLPVGLFDNEPIRRYLAAVFARENRTDDFRRLSRRLYVVAADLDSGRAVRFGEPGFDHVPISRAVQASTALPALYPPVEIDGRSYVDGVLLKTLHGSVALDAGADLVLCLNPIVPLDADVARRSGAVDERGLVARGLPTVLVQTFRTLVHSRLTVGLAAYGPRYPGADVVLFEPGPGDHRMFFTNIFSFAQRRAVCEHAWSATRRNLLERSAELGPILERRGLRLRLDVLRDRSRRLWSGVGLEEPPEEVAGDVEVLDRLGFALDRLERILASRFDPVPTQP